MGVSVAVVRVAANTSTGNQDITTNDLGGLTPKAVLLIATRAVTNNTAVDGAGFYVGASDGTNEWTEAYEEQHGQASMDVEFEQDTTANRILTIYDGTADDVVDATADFDSFISDGVRINWTDAPASAFLITAIFFAGTDLSAHVGTVSLGNTSNALVAVTSVGFEADLVITNLMEGTSVLSASIGMGMIHNNRSGTITQRCTAYGQRNGFASSAVNAVMRNDCSLSRMIETSGNLDWSASAQSFDSSGWDWQLGNSRAPANHHAGWIALRFGSSPVVSSKVYTYSTPTATGSNTDAGPNFTPQFIMYLMTRTATANTSEVDSDAGPFGVGVVDADGDLFTNSIASEDAAADSNTQSLSNSSLLLPTHTGASSQAADFTSFGGTGVTWNWTAADATARQWAALAIEISSSSISGSLSKTQAADTVASSSKLEIKGIVSKTQASDSVSSQSDLIVQGSLSKTQAGDSLLSQGKIEVKANLSATQTSDTISSSALLQIKGTVNKSQDSDSLISAGEIDLVASLNQSQDSNLLSSQSILKIQGALTEAQQGDTLSSESDLRIVGSLSITQQDQTLDGVGSGEFNPPISGELTTEQDNNVVISSATLLTHANLNRVQDNNVLSSSGTVKLSAQLSVTQSNNVLVSQSDIFITGGLSAVQANNTLLSSIDLVLPITGPGLAPVIYAESLQKIKGQKSKVIYAEKINDL